MRSDRVRNALTALRVPTACTILSALSGCAPPAACDWQNIFGDPRNDAQAKLLNSTLVDDPGSVETRYLLAKIYLDEMMFDSAIQQLKDFISLAPRDPRGYQLLWIAYMKSPHPDEQDALDTLKAGVRAVPTSFGIQSMLALHYCDAGIEKIA